MAKLPKAKLPKTPRFGLGKSPGATMKGVSAKSPTLGGKRGPKS